MIITEELAQKFAHAFFYDQLNEQKMKYEYYKGELGGKIAFRHAKRFIPSTGILNETSKSQIDNPNFYIYTSSGKGFVIISNDTSLPLVLGYSFSSSIGEECPAPLVGLLKTYNLQIEKHKSYTTDQRDDSNEPETLLRAYSRNLPKSVVPPLIQTQWHQSNPYNSACPKVDKNKCTETDKSKCPENCAAGCVAIAMAQILNYFQYPKVGEGQVTYNTRTRNTQEHANFGATTYFKDQTLLDVATLVYHCGVSVKMDYREKESSAYTEVVARALKKYFRYGSVRHIKKSNKDDNRWKQILKNTLDKKIPIFYHAEDKGLAHAFICDGYNEQDYFHFNWGWGPNMGNGYFKINILNNEGFAFNRNHQAIIARIEN